jgi:diguanylate cyclase (GGDEF)-like protein
MGTLLVGDRLGDVETFGGNDLRELVAVGNHLGVTLRNARRADLIRESAEDQVRRSRLDELTGLPNRRFLEETLASRPASGGEATAILLDLDRFKDINDTLGHGTGDALLRMVAERLDHSAPADALVARLAGDEFAVLLLSGDDATTASVVALVRHAFAVPFELDDLQVTVEASVGVARAGVDGGPADLLRRADIAMFAAKTRRTGVETYRSDLEVVSPQRLTLLTELRDAITRGELVVHFQPKVRLSDGEPLGAEALVRWIHPTRGMIAPDEFIPVAEHSGLITPLTFAVLRQALDACSGWRRAGRALGVAVNISPRSLLDSSFVDEVARALAAVEVPASAVTLEITESSLMADPERAVEALARLRSLGLHLSIDDLGTGYSSLSYLQRLPVSEVKIDRSFLRPHDQDGDAFAIVGAIVDLGHRLGRSVVAEGVEDEATWRRLQEVGCDVAQGYWMSRPLPAADFTAWLEGWRPSSASALRALA